MYVKINQFQKIKVRIVKNVSRDYNIKMDMRANFAKSMRAL